MGESGAQLTRGSGVREGVGGMGAGPGRLTLELQARMAATAAHPCLHPADNCSGLQHSRRP